MRIRPPAGDRAGSNGCGCGDCRSLHRPGCHWQGARPSSATRALPASRRRRCTPGTPSAPPAPPCAAHWPCPGCGPGAARAAVGAGPPERPGECRCRRCCRRRWRSPHSRPDNAVQAPRRACRPGFPIRCGRGSAGARTEGRPSGGERCAGVSSARAGSSSRARRTSRRTPSPSGSRRRTGTGSAAWDACPCHFSGYGKLPADIAARASWVEGWSAMKSSGYQAKWCTPCACSWRICARRRQHEYC
ncbi:hypothetical protein G6F65_018970 [Rhizopus arrhizus]|nr:hypothetical protein G6F65_018970 [Rhizopus arrhizus]